MQAQPEFYEYALVLVARNCFACPTETFFLKATKLRYPAASCWAG